MVMEEDMIGNAHGDDASRSPSAAVKQTIMLLQSVDPNSAVQAAKDIRRLTKTSHHHRRHFSAAVRPLVHMLSGGSADAKEAALAALLNLAVKDDTNKINIINAGALNPIITFLQSDDVIVQEHAAAALITLSASSHNKPIIGATGAILLLVHVLRCGISQQARSDAAMALYNLSTHQDNVTFILHADPIPPLVTLLKSCKKSSKTAAKCVSLIESLAAFEEGRSKVASVDGGILAVVEVVESGSSKGREHAVGALLTMCERGGSKYREAILGEGVIPGLMEVSVEGSETSQRRAQTLLRLLRDVSCSLRREPERQPLEKIVSSVILRIKDSDDQKRKAKKMVSEMVQDSMEQSLRDLQQRAEFPS